MRLFGRIALGIVGVAFAYLGYLYLSLPDVRSLRTGPPQTTAFMELRASEASAYTELDTPIFTCRRKRLTEILESLA